mgnify:FL=1
MRIKVVKALYAHFQSQSDSVEVSEKNLLYSIDKCYDLYFQMLWLVVEVARYARERIEIARNKKLPTAEDLNPNTKFIDNAVVHRLETSEAVTSYLEKHALGWNDYPELIKELYGTLIASDYYKEYMAKPGHNFRDDVKLVQRFYSDPALEESETLETVLEEQSIYWNDDLGFALIMVERTLETCRARLEEIPVLPEFKSDDDLGFAKTLFRRSVEEYAQNLRYIERFTKNWDVERIAFMDNLIMATAITELITFDSIPVKVTLDEYIEIAKYYSTPGSNMFINGVLDRIVEALEKDGLIHKSGRGLL